MPAYDPAMLVDAQQMLEGLGAGAGRIDTRIIEAALNTEPGLYGTAIEWGWEDTEVRDDLSAAVACMLLGISREEYRRRCHEDELTLNADVLAAQRRWLAANPPEGA